MFEQKCQKLTCAEKGKGSRADPGLLERGFTFIKGWGVRFADYISFFLNIIML